MNIGQHPKHSDGARELNPMRHLIFRLYSWPMPHSAILTARIALPRYRSVLSSDGRV